MPGGVGGGNREEPAYAIVSLGLARVDKESSKHFHSEFLARQRGALFRRETQQWLHGGRLIVEP